MTRIKVEITIKEEGPLPGLPGLVGGTINREALSFTVYVDTLDEVEYRVADTIRAGLAVHPSKQLFNKRPKEQLFNKGTMVAGEGRTKTKLPPTVEDSGDLTTERDIQAMADKAAGDGIGCWPPVTDGLPSEPMKGGKHSGNCSCKGCEEPDPQETERIYGIKPDDPDPFGDKETEPVEWHSSAGLIDPS